VVDFTVLEETVVVDFTVVVVEETVEVDFTVVEDTVLLAVDEGGGAAPEASP